MEAELLGSWRSNSLTGLALAWEATAAIIRALTVPCMIIRMVENEGAVKFQ